MLRVRARDNSCFIAYCNMVGGQDELIFDGASIVLDDEGEVVARAESFVEQLLVVDLDPAAAVGRRLRDVRRRALARERAASEPPDEVRALAAGRARGASSAPPRPSRSTTSSRCGSRSSSGCATTCARTASATSSSGSRAGSTPR